jgi:hypothetical protein
MSQICDNHCDKVLVFRYKRGFRMDLFCPINDGAQLQRSHDTLMLDKVVKLVLNPDALELESIA